MKNKSENFYALSFVLFFYPFFAGGYYVFYNAVVSIIFITLIFINTIKEKKINISSNLIAISIVVIELFYFFTRFWAVDRTMAFEGFIKFLAPTLFLLLILQVEKGERLELLNVVPYSATAMTLISLIFGKILTVQTKFYDNRGDMHGLFEYANAFAQFALIGVIIAILKKKQNKKVLILDILCAMICMYGVYASNSRAALILLVGMLALIAFCYALSKLNSKTKKLVFISTILIAVLVAVIVLIVTGNLTKIADSIKKDHSFVNRSLYYQDAINYIIKHPFGKGAYAFYFAQPEFQSAYYYVIDVHNDYLQFAVEVGILPALLFVVTIVSQFFNKENNYIQKAVLLALSLHCLVDYDLQFISLFFILILCCSLNKTKVIEIKNNVITSVICIGLVIANVLVGLSNFYNYEGDHKKSVYFYKNTPSLLSLMVSTDEQQEGYDYAKEILSLNNNIYEANMVLSRIYQANQMYDEAIAQQELVIKKSPRGMNNYRDYIDLLLEAKNYYEDNGETKLADQCVEKIISVPDKIKKLKSSTPKKAKKYGRHQNFKLGKKYKKIIKKLKESYNKKQGGKYERF